MRIIATFFTDHGEERAEINHYSTTIEQAKENLYLVMYDGVMYEWVMYDTGYGGYDLEAKFSRTRQNAPQGKLIFNVPRSTQYSNLKCGCGAHATGSNRHSTWCDLWRPF